MVQTFLASPAHAAYDPTRFLRDPDFHVLVDENSRPQLSSMEDIAYLAEGPSGAPYLLDLSGDAPDAVSASLFREALGLPNAPSYPVWVQIAGANTAPLSPSSARLDDLARGALRPWTREVDFQNRKLPALLVAEYVGHTLASAITGTSTRAILFTGRHFHVARFLRDENAFGPSSPVSTKTIEWMHEALPPNIRLQIQRFGPPDFDIFASVINRILSRLQALKPDEVRLLLGASFGGTQELMDRIQAVEPALRGALIRMKAADELIGKIGVQQGAGVPPPHVKIPSRNAERLAKSSLAEITRMPVQVLWALYFNPANPQLRKWADRWSAQTKSLEADTGLANLLRAARLNVEEVYVVSHHMQPNLAEPARDKLASLADLERNGRILIVTAAARQDQESRVISGVAERAGAKHFLLSDLPRNSDRREDDRALAKEILDQAHGNHSDTIVLVEMKESDGLERWLAGEGRRIVVVDHHQNAEMDRSHPRSSLEQVAEILGHTLSPSEYAIALIDRLGTRGARHLGVSDLTLRAHYQTLPTSLQGVKPIETSRGRLYITDKPMRHLGPNLNYVNLIEYPGYANVLMISPGLIRFAGHPSTVRELREYFGQERGELAQSTYSNGDYGIYWAMRVSPLDFDDVVGRITWYLENGYQFLGSGFAASTASEQTTESESPAKSDRTRNKPKEKQKKPPVTKHHQSGQRALNMFMNMMACRQAIQNVTGPKPPLGP